jgi:hypothetical protein
MFCPKCGAEYREGFYRCADCEIDLVPELPPAPEQPAEYLNLVHIETYSDRHEADLVKGLLSANGIDAFVQGDEFGGYEPVLSFLKGVRLLVKEEDLEDAKKLLEEIPGTI